MLVFAAISSLAYGQTVPNFPEKKINNRYKNYVDTSTIVILNDRIFTINDSTVQNFLKGNLDKETTTIQVINDEKSKTKIKHILIIHTNEAN